MEQLRKEVAADFAGYPEPVTFEHDGFIELKWDTCAAYYFVNKERILLVQQEGGCKASPANTFFKRLATEPMPD